MRFLYDLADPAVPLSERSWFPLDSAGKLMALAAYGSPAPQPPSKAKPSKRSYRWIYRRRYPPAPNSRPHFETRHTATSDWSPQEFKDLAWQFSQALFNRFYASVQARVNERIPLLVAGGCALNCDWNTQWKDSNLFTDVFVPPCANDSGIAIGTAIDALHHYTGDAKIGWNVYCG